MAENSGIEWTNHTFNPWIGCTKISPACDNCYAADWDKRYEGGKHWGPKAERRRTGEKNWRLPLKWNEQAKQEGKRFRVFCASLADVFDNAVPQEWRDDLFKLIESTPDLDWLLLTKRPQNIRKMYPEGWLEKAPHNVWLGTTVENQEVAERNIPALCNVPARIRFLSCEPLLGPIDLSSLLAKVGDGGDHYYNCLDGSIYDEANGLTEDAFDDVINWVITGGESGTHFRDADPNWFRGLRDQCAAAKTPFLFKQWGGIDQRTIKKIGRELDGVIHDGYPVTKP